MDIGPNTRSIPISVTGSAARVPGDDLWATLSAGTVHITMNPPERWARVCAPGTPQTVYRGGFLAEMDHLDATFFNLGWAEANFLDPHIRGALETAAEALSDTGRADAWPHAHTGVFSAATSADFGFAVSVGNMPRTLAHVLGLQGPTEHLDKACTSSHLAIHEARIAVLTDKCEYALVVACTLMLHTSVSLQCLLEGIMSPSGNMRPLDRQGDGLVRGEASAAVVLHGAPSDSLGCLATLHNCGFTRNSSKLSVMTPDLDAQERAIQIAQPNGTTGLHIHGTGQPVSDASELLVYKNALHTDELAVMNHKANIGHSVATSGILALIVTATTMHNQVVPAHRRLERPVKLLSGLVPVQMMGTPQAQLMSVHGHAMTGVNVHFVVGRGSNRSLHMAGVNTVAWCHTRSLALGTLVPSHELIKTPVTHVDERTVAAFVSATLQEIVGRVVEPHENVFGAGMRSSDGTRVVQQVSSQFGVALSPLDLLMRPTAHEFSEWLYAELKGGLVGAQDDEIPPSERVSDGPSEGLNSEADSSAMAAHHPPCSAIVVFVVQLLGTCSVVGLAVVTAYPFILLLHAASHSIGNTAALMLLPLVLTAQLLALALVVALVRHFTTLPPGIYPIWSVAHLKWWYGQLLFRVAHAALVPLFGETGVMVGWFRLLGAQIGSDCRLTVAEASCLELLAVGSHCRLTAHVQCHLMWDGCLQIKGVLIGDRCSNGTASAILPGTVMADDAHLMPLSSVSSKLGAGRWIGSPARRRSEKEEGDPIEEEDQLENSRLRIRRLVLQGLGVCLLPYIVLLEAVPSIYFVTNTRPDILETRYALLLFVSFGLLLWVLIQFVVYIPLKLILVGNLRPGQQYHIDSFLAVRLWFVEGLGVVPKFVLNLLFGHVAELRTLYWTLLGSPTPLGAQAAGNYRLTEVSLIRIGLDTFVGGTTFIVSTTSGSVRTCHNVQVGDCCDVAIRSVVAGHVEDNAMVGSLCWLPHGESVPPRHTAMGTPARFVSLDTQNREFMNKPRRLSVGQVIWVFGGMFPIIVVCILVAIEILEAYDSNLLANFLGICHRDELVLVFGHRELAAEDCVNLIADLFWLTFGSDPPRALERLTMFGVALFCARQALLPIDCLIKWCLLGRVKPMSVSPHEGMEFWHVLMHTCVHTLHFLAHGAALRNHRGTVLWTGMLRALGSKVGSQALIESLFVFDFDLLHFGDQVCINSGANVLGHLFQYGELQYDEVHIGEGCNMGVDAQLVPGVTLLECSSLLAISRAFNGEELQVNKKYGGSPAVMMK
eukprot:TRINITY_DN4390_c0_g5_i1.p1 TRINITY_DN4390_c0_g5~~TRINITY_DN4390_c0_g5_i1.p1  ORF type:complete len:1281 (+),score=247.07 TRINITY_DN4390_c0_g5_i1:116-3958(+)